MTTEVFQRFLVERLLDLDGSLSDTPGSVLYTKVVDPVIRRLGVDPMTVDIEEFILARLQDEFPDLDVNSPGSVLRDVLVSPLVLLLEPLQVEIAHLQRQKSLSDIDTLSEEEMDALLSNFLLERLSGEQASCVVRVFFSSPRTVSVDSSITFRTGSGVQFVPASPTSFYASDMRRSGNLYFLDIPVVSLLPTTEANVGVGDIKFVSGLDGVVRVTNNVAASGGVTAETNESFLARAERAITERSLNTKRGIETTLKNNFAGVLSVEVVGYGEPDMQRDILQADGTSTTVEVAGPMVYATSSFRTLQAINPGGAIMVPFTNTLRLHNVPDSKVAAIQAAKYVRVVDGNGYFDGRMLSRLREIDSTLVDVPQIAGAGTSDVVIRLKDFAVYPPQPSLTSAAAAGELRTDANEFGFNRFSRRGSEWVLFSDDGGTSKVTGAPLPFSDYIDASALSGLPSAVIPGRDFLVSVTKASSWQNAAHSATPAPDRVRLYPLDSYYTGGYVGISRTDSVLDSRLRVNYTGPSTYQFQSSLQVSGATDKVEVKDFGGPNTAAPWTPAAGTPVLTRYDGISKPSYGRNPGVSIRIRDPGVDPPVFTTATVGTQAKEVDVLLHPSTADWLARGVSPGDHIACCVMHDYDVPANGFTGDVAEVSGRMAWHGWGKISAIDPALPHVARVVGLDVHRLHTSALIAAQNTFAGFTKVAGFAGQFPPTTVAVAATPQVPTPAPDGATTTLVFQLDKAPGVGYPAGHPGVVPASVSIDSSASGTNYTDLGGSGVFWPHADLVSGTVDYLTGVVTLVFAAPPAPGTTYTVAYSYYTQDMYRAYWTVYRGERELVAPDGALVTSYDELTFAPAYKRHNEDAVVWHSMPSGYMTSPTSGGVDTKTGFHDGISRANIGMDSAGGDNPQVGAWIRLNKSFYEHANSLGDAPSKLAYSAEITSLETVLGLTSNPPQDLYAAARLDDYLTLDTRLGVSTKAVRTVVSLPYVDGGLRVSNVSDKAAISVDKNTSVLENSKGHSGYLLPHPMGSLWMNAAQPWSIPGWAANLNLYNQLVEIYDSASVTASTTKVTVSQIPGSVPFPGNFPGNLEITNNQLHIGGLTDVYLKGASETGASAGPIVCNPEFPGDTIEVLVEGRDGSVAASDEFTSPDLIAYLAAAYSLGGSTVALDDLAVVILDQTSLTPTAARVLHNTAGGVRVDGTFSDTKANLHWQLISRCSTNLVEPLIVLQQGADLATVAGSEQVVSGGFTFIEDPAVVDVYLKIDTSGPDSGLYRVVSKGAGQLVLDTPMTTSAQGVSYRVCLQQSNGVQLPLVRVAKVTLAGDAEGVVVPYKDPVDIRGSSFGGLNNDPITDTSSHGSGTGTLGTNGTALTFTTATPVDFQALGVQKYDVLRLDGMDDPLRYFYVVGFSGANTLILDRLESSVTTSITGLSFTLGHPSIGTAELRFLDPTFIAVNQRSEFSAVHNGTTVRLRPSPAESATVYRSAVGVSGVTVAAAAGVNKVLESTAVDFFQHGVAAGDTVQILSRVIYSQNLASSTAYNVAGKSLVISVGGSRSTVVFTGTNPRTLDDIVSDINNVLQDKLVASVEEVVPATTWRLAIASRNAVEITDEGSTGILTTLGFTVLGDRKNTTPTTMISSFTVASVAYSAGVSSITLTADTTATLGAEVFIHILRAGEQRLYPGDLTQAGTGLWAGSVRLTSMDPLTDVALTDGASLAVSGHRSFGYDTVVENDNYSYSMGESCSLRVTPYILASSATDMSSAFVLPRAKVNVGYERSQLVQDVQAYMLNPEVRVVNHNPLVRHFLPAYPVMGITYSGDVPESRVLAAVSEFLESLYPNQDLEVFDLTSVLSGLGLRYVAYPQEAAFLVHDKNRVLRVVRGQDIVALGKSVHLMGDMSRVFVTRVG